MLCAIPIEIVNRELDAVLHLALHLAARGMPVLFGQNMVGKYVFEFSKGRPVIYFDQDQHQGDNERVVGNGGYVVNLNAEGQNLDTKPQFVEMFAKIAHTLSYMFVRGERQREALQNRFAADRRHVVAATGHPAFDLLHSSFRPFHENADIVAEHGRDYILINTQFVVFNHKMGIDNYWKMIRRQKEFEDIYKNEAYLKTLEQKRKRAGKLAQSFVDLARELAGRFPERHVILRPHPMEGTEFYTSQLSGIPNLFVKHSGPVLPWLASAGAVVHNSCTTGLEGLVMGKLVVRYDPLQDDGEDNMQSMVGVEASTVEQVAERIQSGDMPVGMRAQQLEAVRPWAANVDTCAAAAIADLVAGLGDSGETWIPEKLGWLDSVKCWRKYLSKCIRQYQPGYNGRKVRYALEKFGRLRLEDVAARTERLRSVEEDAPEVVVRQLGLNVFIMEPAGRF